MPSIWRSVWAVTAGVLVTWLLGALLGGLVGAILAGTGTWNGANMSQTMLTPLFLGSTLLIGLLATILGGYQAGKIAGHAEILHASLVGILLTLSSIGIALLARSLAPGGPQAPAWYQIFANAITLPAAVAGGVLAHWRFGSPGASE